VLSNGRVKPLALFPFSFVVAIVSILPVAAKEVMTTYATEMNPAYRDVDIDVAPDPSGKPAPSAGFNHPGVLINRAQLEELKRRVAAREEPQKTAYAQMKANPFCQPAYVPHPVPTVMSGPYSKPEVGAKAEQADCDAAYGQALLWCITGNHAYADTSIRILNAWSQTLKGGHRYANGPAQAAWTGPVFARAAEIIRFTDAGWADEDVARFQNMLRTQFLPFVMHGDRENGNKELSMTEALINIGVFLDDRKVFDLGLRMWRGRTPAYIYLKSDGPKPIQPPGCTAVWSNKDFMPQLVDGLTQETARDSHHPWLAISSMVNAAETARQQGVDLYGEQGKRIMAALEYVAQFLPPNHAPVPENLEFSRQPTWEIAYNNYHNRMGNSLPLMGAVLDHWRPTGVDHQMAWETLTHAGMGSIGLPPVKH